eukprot:COSAG01_NODE_44536_length_418_cov_0.793103_1_plen_92_part_01
MGQRLTKNEAGFVAPAQVNDDWHISFAMNVHLIPDGLEILPAHFTRPAKQLSSPSPHVLSLSLLLVCIQSIAANYHTRGCCYYVLTTAIHG